MILPSQLRTLVRQAERQYGFIGYAGRRRAKLTWPLVLVNMTLSTSVESYLADSLKLDLKHTYLGAPQNVSHLKIPTSPRN